jgi:hypothetical protein
MAVAQHHGPARGLEAVRDKVLAKGYREFFADTSKPFHERAVVSDGDSMEATRFYFADAAMEQGMHSLTGLSAQSLHLRISDVSRNVNFALKFIVVAYIKKIATLSRYNPPTPPPSSTPER